MSIGGPHGGRSMIGVWVAIGMGIVVTVWLMKRNSNQPPK
jgi:hypothetical protein